MQNRGVMMRLIIGLGNPGKEYDKTRHNCGFMVIDALQKRLQVECNQNKFQGLYVKTKYQGQDVILLKPQTYMNNSGESVQQIMSFFKIAVDDILVIYDDLDMPVGKLRLRTSGSAGGHNGIKSIINHVGSQECKRIRVGIDRHPYQKVVDYVLSKFSKEEVPLIEEGIEKATDAVLMYLEKDFVAAMNAFN